MRTKSVPFGYLKFSRENARLAETMPAYALPPPARPGAVAGCGRESNPVRFFLNRATWVRCYNGSWPAPLPEPALQRLEETAEAVPVWNSSNSSDKNHHNYFWTNLSSKRFPVAL